MPASLQSICAAARPAIVGPGAAVLDASGQIAGSANTTLRVNAFRIDDKPTIRAFGDAVKRGVKVEVTFDPDTLSGKKERALGEDGIAMLPYGTDPYKQHSKAVVADAKAALVATDVSDKVSRARLDTGVTFGGDAARALDRLMTVGDSETPAVRAQAVEDAARAGVLVNDPRLGAHTLSDGIRTLVDNSAQRLRIATKKFTAAGVANGLIAAARRGVSVEAVSQEFDPDVRQAMEGAGIEVHEVKLKHAIKDGTGIHGTLLVADDQALVASLFLAGRVLHGSDGRQSRELGAVVEGALVEDVARVIDRAASSD